MAKKKLDNLTAVPTDGRLITFAEDLGRVLGTTQAKASAWLNQRQHIAKQLTQVRDTAERLLADLTGGVRQVSAQVQGAATSAGRRRRRLSAEARKRMSEAAKRRWAKRKARAGAGKNPGA